MNKKKPLINSKYISTIKKSNLINELFINVITNKQYFTQSEYNMARDYILVNCNSIVANLATSKSYQYPKIDPEEFRQAGLLGLVKSLEQFNPQKNTKFTSFVFMVIKNEIGNIIKMSYTQKRKSNGIISLNEKIKEDKDDELGELIIDTKQEELFKLYVVNDTLQQIYKLLNNEDRKLIDAYLYCDGHCLDQYLKIDNETCRMRYVKLFKRIRQLIINQVNTVNRVSNTDMPELPALIKLKSKCKRYASYQHNYYLTHRGVNAKNPRNYYRKIK